MRSDFSAEEVDKARDVLVKASVERRTTVSESQTVVKCKCENISRAWLGLFDGQNNGQTCHEARLDSNRN